MKITTYTGLVGFLLTLSALSGPAVATSPQPSATGQAMPTVEARLNRLTAAIRQREAQLGEALPIEPDLQVAGWANGANRGAVAGPRGRGWADGTAGRDWTNARVGGTVSGPSGTFANVNPRPWTNAWVNGGGFYNYYRPGATFVNY